MMGETSNFRARRLYTYQHVNALCAIVDALGDDDGKHLPLPEGLPDPPTNAVKREIKNQLMSTLRLILAHNDANLSDAEMRAY